MIRNSKDAYGRLKKQSDKDNYQGDLINATVESVIKHYGGLKENCKEDQVDEDTMAKVAKIIPSDQALNMIQQCGLIQSKGRVRNFFKGFIERHPELAEVLRSNIRLNRATGAND